jgi:Flp pilus assembly pilin Flp
MIASIVSIVIFAAVQTIGTNLVAFFNSIVNYL